jgi:hypothetical protein
MVEERLDVKNIAFWVGEREDLFSIFSECRIIRENAIYVLSMDA